MRSEDMEERERVEVEGAHGDVQRLRTLVEKAARGERDGSEVVEAVVAHYRQHGTTHKALGTPMLDQVRLAVLDQLNGWRQQLQEQLPARGRR
jgi:hypothetical protein